MSECHTYFTQNSITGEVYVGKSNKAPDASYLGSGLLLKEQIKEYGRGVFVKKIIDYNVPEDLIDDLEVIRIAEFREMLGPEMVLNIAAGGTGGDTLSHHPRKAEIYAEIGRKVSATLMGHVPSEETRELWSQQRTGKSPSQETRDKLSVTMTALYESKPHPSKGTKLNLSEEERKRRSDAAKAQGLGSKSFHDLSPEKQLEVSEKLSKAATGRVVAQSTRNKISTTLTGRKRSQETKDKISATLKARNAELKNINQKQKNT